MAVSTSVAIGTMAATLGGALTVAVLAVGSGSAGSAAPPRPAPDPADPTCEALLDRYVELGLERVTPYGWDYPYVYEADFAEGGMAAASGDAAAPLPATDRVTQSGSGTNVQEAGVDEPDVVKTDGTLLIRLQNGDLVTYDVTGDQPEQMAELELPSLDDPEILLADDRVVVTGGEPGEGEDQQATRVLVVDVADPGAPSVADEATYDSGLVTARLHGDTVQLVLDRGLPDLPFVHPRWWRDEDSALERNRKVVSASSIEDWLPIVTRADKDSSLLDCADVTVPDDEAGLGTLAVVGFDPAEPDTWSGSGVVTDSATAYFSADRMYLAAMAAPRFWGGPCCLEPQTTDSFYDGTTELLAFELASTDTAYVASGQVAGSIADRWSMDEYGGVLRVAVGPSADTANANSIVTLREEGDDLVELGRVDELGVDETIESMRWFDGLAIMVTFRQVDPLYAVDLTDPASPQLLGSLKIPGFSEYLHPLGSQRLVGIGQGAGTSGAWGAQAALFDVADLTEPRQLDVVTYGSGSEAGAATDPRQFTWLPDERTVLTVVTRGGVGSVSVLTLADGRMSNRAVEVAYGDEVAQVRLVPLPDGRVVLVTGDEVSFFSL